VRTGKAVTQNYLHYAKTINDCYRYLESTLPTVGERGVGEIERNLEAQGFVGNESLLRARRRAPQKRHRSYGHKGSCEHRSSLWVGADQFFPLGFSAYFCRSGAISLRASEWAIAGNEGENP
jgi:hypothetical protein